MCVCVSADVSSAVGSAASVSGSRAAMSASAWASAVCAPRSLPHRVLAADAALEVPSSAQTLPAAHRPAPSAQLLSAAPFTAGAGAAFL